MTVEPFPLELADRTCPLCASNGESVVTAEANVDPQRLGPSAFASRKLPEYMHHRLVQCASCDLLYANPAPTANALALAYADAEYDSAEESRFASSTYACLLREVLPTLPLQGGALDIGTGDGAFLAELLASGFEDVVGVEPSRAPVAAASSEVKGLIRTGFFRPEDFEPERFRLVSSFQTLEHVCDPLSLCCGAYQLLCEGGALLVVCHNRRALLNRAMGRRSPIYDVEHLQLFCPRSLRSLLERSGFSDIELRPVLNRYPLRYWMKLFPLPDGFKGKLLALVDRGRLGSVPLSVPVGNLAAIGYKRGGAPVDPTEHAHGKDRAR